MPIALVTGTSTGIGLATALELARRGFEVRAGLRTAASGEELLRAAAKETLPVTPVILDVDDDAAVERAVAEVTAGGPVDVLVNNAGVGGGGAIEDVPLDFARRLFETNYFGAIRMIRAVLPGMRARRAGTIVNVTSVAGRVALAAHGHYCAVKHALEAASLALAQEVRPFGIRVVVIEPGVVLTPIFSKARRFTDDRSPYFEHLRRLIALFQAGLRKPTMPETVAAAIADAVTTDRPRLRYLVGADAEALVAGRAAISDEEWVEDGRPMSAAEHAALVRRRYGIDVT